MPHGPHNALTDVEGLLVGHHGQPTWACGVSVVLCPEGAVAGVDVRGSAPGTRETDLLAPLNLVEKAQAVVLTGGSVYGLATADGVLRWLAARGQGFPLAQGQVAPIVPAAALFDLGRGQEYVPPIVAAWGAKACDAARDGALELGSVGAGTGALAGGIKGGLGSASEVLDNGLTVAALVAVNSLGSVLDPASGLLWEARLEIDGELGPLGWRPVRPPAPDQGQAGRNTTIGVVATDALLSKVQAQKLAQMAHDGLARAIRPAHTMFDGDTIFCLATGRRPLPATEGFFAAPQAQALNELGRAMADCFTRAVMRGVVEAVSLPGLTALRDLPQR
jgi:L-aminopeptidase/D-esterase-like protein